MNKNDIGLWSMIDNASVDSPERVILIKVKNSDQLKNTLNELKQILTATDPATLPNPLKEYYNTLNSANINNNQITGFIADKKLVLKVVYEKEANGPETMELSNDAKAALENIDVPTIDLQDLKTAPFTFANANVKRVILPDGWDKASVTAAGEAIKAVNAGFEVALSQDDSNSALAAYVNKPGSLYLAMRHTFYDGHGITKLGTQNPNTYSLGNLKYLTLTGSPAARDFNGGATDAVKFDENGHFVFDKEADETSTEKDAAVGGGKRQLVGTTMNGAIVGANLILLDLEDAIITEEHNSDLTISWSYSAVAKNGEGPGLKEVRFPTTPLLKTLPADCLNGDYAFLEELCIPGNIEVLKTRACWISTNILRHVWTTGSTNHMVYDNGAYLVPAAGEDPVVDHTGHAPLDDTVWNAGNSPEQSPRYGTITLPENLKLIESHNFTARSVSDVYVLAKTAPECHVDAFSTIMYLGNNTIDTQYIVEQGMVTRQAYAQSVAKGEYIAFLHYPRECGTPDIQRYTDPTREYSVATTLRDGKGNVIYFPNQSELNRAYLQGTTGYVWYAWDSERIPDNGDNGDANSFKNCNPGTLTSHNTEAQNQANGFYNDNTMTDPDKTDRSFYDVRMDTNEQPNVGMPSGLDWYYNTEWEGKQLYPQAVSTTADYVYIRDAEGDYVLEVKSTKDGDTYSNTLVFRPYTGSDDDKLERFSRKQVYSYNQCSGGDYVQDYSYVEDDANGQYVHDVEYGEDPTGNYVKDYEYRSGSTYYHPLEATAAPTEIYGNYDHTQYYYPTVSYDPVGGDYVNVWNNYVTSDRSTWPTWALTNPDFASEFENQWTNGTHYTKTITGYTQCTSKDDVSNHQNELYKVSERFAVYSTDVTDYFPGVNGDLFDKVYLTSYRPFNADTDLGETLYSMTDNGYREYNASTDEGMQLYTKQYNGTYRLANSTDASDEQRYCYEGVDYVSETPITYTKKNDYRGWHQFVLTAYATNDDRPLTPVKFYQTDNDWWTICLPYDLSYNDMKMFFGNKDTGAIPYLSKLRYVVRDYDKEKITLMFSKNLMEYKEVITNPSITDDYVHGVIDDEMTYTDAELADDPIILHKGVPYLIRPNIPTGANRQFDVYQTETPELYKRLIDSQNVPGAALETYIYKGEYTVPAYVIGDNAPEATVESRSFQHAPLPSEGMSGGPKFTYNSSDQIMYDGKKVSAKISKEFSYTFVGSFFLSILPKYCYFLGWDSDNKRAAFWYNKLGKKDEYAWNNQTGVICANFDTSTQIDPATGLNDPAKWYIPEVANDDLKGTSATGNAKVYGMDCGGSVDVVVSGIGKINADNIINDSKSADVIFNMQGVRMSQPLNRLPKGIYIMNGKKYVVK